MSQFYAFRYKRVKKPTHRRFWFVRSFWKKLLLLEVKACGKTHSARI